MNGRLQKMENEVWVFGDYRDYGRNRVTLELLARARGLADELGTRCAVAVIGHRVEPYIMEYIAHGAEAVYVMDAPHLGRFRAGVFTEALCRAIKTYLPQILLVGATDFGREFAPRVAKRLGTGLSADCIALEIDQQEERILVQTAPAFDGRLLAEVITPDRRPQMATVRPGIFSERPHDAAAAAEVIYLDPVEPLEPDPLEIISVEPIPQEAEEFEKAAVVISGGRGMGNEHGFHYLHRLAELLGGQVGGTRPAVHEGWITADRMIGQTGRSIRPKVLITCGTSGAIQYTAAFQGAEYVIAINRDPNAAIFDHADLGIVGDACEIIPRLIQALKCRGIEEEASYA
jgi:electron transfer flavoprotein alpha subunit